MTPYTYLIGWAKLNRYYYGVRFSKNCEPNDLFKTYFTSSKRVKKIILEHGNPDIIQIRRTFKDAKSAREWEHKVLKRLGAAKNPKWINQSDNICIQHDEESIRKMKESLRKTMLKKYGVEYSSQREEWEYLVKATKKKKYGSENFNNMEKQRKTMLEKYGVEHSSQLENVKESIRKKSLEKYGVSCSMNNPKTKEKIRQENLKKYGVEYYSQTKECEQKRKDGNMAKYGVDNYSKTEEFKKAHSIEMKKYWENAPEITCPHCAKVLTNMGNYNRYHGNMCKAKPVCTQSSV
jgi:hypothetical protein